MDAVSGLKCRSLRVSLFAPISRDERPVELPGSTRDFEPDDGGSGRHACYPRCIDPTGENGENGARTALTKRSWGT
jgi:hypothetical protein